MRARVCLCFYQLENKDENDDEIHQDMIPILEIEASKSEKRSSKL